jgi:hypothetical protein
MMVNNPGYGGIAEPNNGKTVIERTKELIEKTEKEIQEKKEIVVFLESNPMLEKAFRFLASSY